MVTYKSKVLALGVSACLAATLAACDGAPLPATQPDPTSSEMVEVPGPRQNTDPKVGWVRVWSTLNGTDPITETYKRCDKATLVYVGEYGIGSKGGSGITAIPNSPECS